VEADNPVNEANPHISNIGKMVEVGCADYVYLFVFHAEFSFSGNGKQNEKLFE